MPVELRKISLPSWLTSCRTCFLILEVLFGAQMSKIVRTIGFGVLREGNSPLHLADYVSVEDILSNNYTFV
eukprot:SAG31_NODE_457_length_15415_cov_4.380387_3_plen_71_part_00